MGTISETPRTAAVNIIDRSVIEISPVLAFAWHNIGEAILIDIREHDEWNEVHIPGTLLAPMSDFDAECLSHWPGKCLVIICGIGKRSEAVARSLIRHGAVPVYNLAGGLAAWRAGGLPVTLACLDDNRFNAVPDELLYQLNIGPYRWRYLFRYEGEVPVPPCTTPARERVEKQVTPPFDDRASLLEPNPIDICDEDRGR